MIVTVTTSAHDNSTTKFSLETDSEEYGFCEAIYVPNDSYFLEHMEFEPDNESAKIWRAEHGQKSMERAIIFIENHNDEIRNQKEIEYDDTIVQVREILDKHNFFTTPYWFGDKYDTYNFVLDLIEGMRKTPDLAMLAKKERLHGNTSNSLRDLNITIDLLNDLSKVYE